MWNCGHWHLVNFDNCRGNEIFAPQVGSKLVVSLFVSRLDIRFFFLSVQTDVLTTGCQWRQLPKDFPSKSVVHDYMICWDRDGVLTRVHDALYATARELAGRTTSASLGIVDSQSVKGAEKGGLASIRRATTPARKSKARRGISASIRKAS